MNLLLVFSSECLCVNSNATYSMKGHSSSISSNHKARSPTVLYLICVVVFFSLLVFGIQSSIFSSTTSTSTGFFRSTLSILNFLFKYANNKYELCVYLIQSGIQRLDINAQQDVRTLNQFQSSVQQCVVSFPSSLLRFLQL